MMLHLMLVLVMLLAGAFQSLMLRQATAFSQAAHAACAIRMHTRLGEELCAEGIARFIGDRKIIDELNARETVRISLSPWPTNGKAADATCGVLQFIRLADARYKLVVRLSQKEKPARELYSCTVLISYDERARTATVTFDG